MSVGKPERVIGAASNDFVQGYARLGAFGRILRMTESKSLVPVEQKEVEFYSDMIVAVRLADGGVYIPIKPVCDLLGVDWGGQYRRVQRDPVLSQEIQRIDVTSTRRGTER